MVDPTLWCSPYGPAPLQNVSRSAGALVTMSPAATWGTAASSHLPQCWLVPTQHKHCLCLKHPGPGVAVPPSNPHNPPWSEHRAQPSPCSLPNTHVLCPLLWCAHLPAPLPRLPAVNTCQAAAPTTANHPQAGKQVEKPPALSLSSLGHILQTARQEHAKSTMRRSHLVHRSRQQPSTTWVWAQTKPGLRPPQLHAYPAMPQLGGSVCTEDAQMPVTTPSAST